MTLLNMSRPESRELVSALIEKTKKVQKSDVIMKKGTSLLSRIKNIEELIQKELGHYAEQLELIQTKQKLHDYITIAIENDIISIDTETTGLNPISDKIVGVCIYTYNQKPAYIPINHISYLTNIRLANQLTAEEVREEFQRLVDAKTKCIFFNAKFDIRVMRNQLNVFIEPAWCGYIASKCLKENEEESNLKYLWKKYCAEGRDKEGKHFTFEGFFKGLNFQLVPIKTAYLYAAKDALMTMQLYEFQKRYLVETESKCIEANLTRLAKLYKEIELPIINIVADIEEEGVALDLDYCKKLSEQYKKLLDEARAAFDKEYENYKSIVTEYVLLHPNSKIENPININSSIQLAELFYDILQQPNVNKKKPRSTDETTLEKLNHPLTKHILKYKGIYKLISTYIDKMPETLNPKTKRIHCNFNAYGTATGRFSSTDPNLQNIPSKNTDIRKMFIASREKNVKAEKGKIHLLVEDEIQTLAGIVDVEKLKIGDILICKEGNFPIKNIERAIKDIWVDIGNQATVLVKRLHFLVGGDFSQQEPKITADMSNDEKFIKDCAAGKDAYATVASLAYKKPYEDCLEFYLDENGNQTTETNKEGKKRRSEAKKILLGISYGKQIKSIAEDLNITIEKAQQIYDAVLTNIPGLKHFMQESEEMARCLGYVETRWGRRRHLPLMQLPKFEIISKGNKNFDPFFDSEKLGVIDDTEKLKRRYLEELENAKYKKQKDSIKLRAEQDGLKVIDNTFKIEEETRKCVNSRIQGSAADMTKIAMRLIHDNKRLQELGFKMLILVHDEIIGECPAVNAVEAAEIFEQCMIDSAKDLRTGGKCDTNFTLCWYGKEYDKEHLTIENIREIKKEVFVV